MTKLLIVNPNSSTSVTENLEAIISSPPNVTLKFYTGPSSSPKEIDGYETSISSTDACFPDLKSQYIDDYDGFLICCYSDHPLIYKLREITNKPVLGIFQATLVYSLSKSPEKFGILTSTSSWESILDSSTKVFFGGVDVPLFTGTVASNVNVLQLAKPENFEKLLNRTRLITEKGARTVLLGCAGLSGLESKLTDNFPGVEFVDSVKVGVELLNSLVRFQN